MDDNSAAAYHNDVIKTVKYPNFHETTDENAEQLLYRNNLQRLALLRFKTALNEFKEKQKEVEQTKQLLKQTKELYEQKEKELKEIYIKTLPYLEVVNNIPHVEEESLKEWDDSVSSSFDTLKKYLIYKPLTVVKDKTIYIAKEGINSLPSNYQDKIIRGIDLVSDYIPVVSIE